MREPAYETRPLREDERDWLSEVLLERWGGELIVGRRLIEAAAEAERAQGARELVVMTNG